MRFKSALRSIFSSLAHKDFRYFWVGQVISTVGGMVQVTALNWYVYKISGSPFLLGLMGVFEFGPVLLLCLFAGVYIERFNKKKILLYTQALFLLQSLALAICIWTGVTQYWVFALLAVLAGIATSVDQPTRQSYFVDLVGIEDLPNAISLNSTAFNLARILGPAIAGLIMKSVGIAECFLINSISFIPVIIGLMMIKVSGKRQVHEKDTHVIKNIKTGILYTFRNEKLYPTFLILAIVCTFSMNANVVLPVFAKDVMLGDEGTYSLLMSMLGFGSMLGALFMAAKGRSISTRYFIIYTAVAIGSLQMLTLIPLYHPAIYPALLLILIGFFNLCFLNRCNTRVQLNTDDNYRGRVMSIYVLVATGSTPLGNSLTGFMMSRIGERFGFFMNGLISCLFVLLIFYLYKQYIAKARVIK